jgi:hypothetical protein
MYFENGSIHSTLCLHTCGYRPYSMEDIHMCEDTVLNESNHFQSTSIWFQSFDTLDFNLDKSLEKNGTWNMNELV